jgi:hypothetical protein
MEIGILLLSGLLSAAQPATDEIVPLNERGFNVPFKIKNNLIQEVILFESVDQGRSWNQKAVKPPSDDPVKNAFVVNVPADGVYWYSLTVVDRNNVRDPVHPSKAVEIMKVLVDTKRPDVRLNASRQGEMVVAEWNIQEENPKLSTFKLEYRTADMPADRWVVVDTTPQLVGRAGFKPAGTAAVTVRLSMLDLAKNSGGDQVEVGAAVQPIGVPVPPANSSVTPANDGGVGSPFQARPAAGTREHAPTVPDALEPITGSGGPVPPKSFGNTTAGGALATTGTQGPAMSPPGGGTPAPPRGPVAGLEYRNTNRLNVEYTVDKVGASGIGSVDLYWTRDDGANWQRLTGEQITPTAPGLDGMPQTKRTIAAELPGEGRYGLYLIVRSGVGLGKQPPKSGDRPQMRVEVDMTPPEGVLYGLQPVQGQTDSVIVRWKAGDLNLAERPIRLEWSERKGGPWSRISDTDLANTGYYTWKLPSQIPGRVYLKMTISDLAGNAGVAETLEPVTIDLSEPEAKIISIK